MMKEVAIGFFAGNEVEQRGSMARLCPFCLAHRRFANAEVRSPGATWYVSRCMGCDRHILILDEVPTSGWTSSCGIGPSPATSV